MKTTIFRKVSVKEPPKNEGWYDTDKGELFWFSISEEWSCRDDRVSEERPTVWYKAIELPSEKDVDNASTLYSSNKLSQHAYSNGIKFILNKILK